MPRTILILSSTPRETAPPRVTEEVREIEEAIRRSRYRDQYEVIVRLGLRAHDLHRALLEHRPAIVHVAGHACTEQGVILADQRGDSLLASNASLVEMLSHLEHGTECVLLDTCNSREEIDEISRHIPFVIGMNASLDDHAAVSFATAFYDSLANGESIASAYELACSAVSVHDSLEGRIAAYSSIQVEATARGHAQASCEERRRPSPGSPHQHDDWSTMTFAPSIQASEDRHVAAAAFLDALREAVSFDTLVDDIGFCDVPGSAPVNAAPPHLIGNYRLLRCLGAGGMGMVYEAIHNEIGKRVAVKILREERALEWRHVQRFINEARAASQIQHPGIIDVHDAGLFGRNWCLVMELLEGRDLGEILKDDARPFSESAALHVIRQVASALAAAHAKGIIHRDIKPGNIFLVRDPRGTSGARVKLLDFGIAKLIELGGAELTESGIIMGTPRYMSPEQCRGTDEVDQRSDLYSLGIVLFEMLCGCHPFPGRSSAGYIAAHLTEPVPPVQRFAPRVSASTAAIVADLLVKSPNARIASARVLLDRLNESLPE
jgi:tRNA A-37 threonylcarbamoyl transferase component Bud32